MMNLNSVILSGAAQTSGIALSVIQSIAKQQMQNFELQKELGKSETTLSCSLGDAIHDSEMDDAYNTLSSGIAGVVGSGVELGCEVKSSLSKSAFTKNEEMKNLSAHKDVITSISQQAEGTTQLVGPDTKADGQNNTTKTYLSKVNVSEKIENKEELTKHLTEARKVNADDFDAFSRKVDDEYSRLSTERKRADDDLEQKRRRLSNIGSLIRGFLGGLGQVIGSTVFKFDQADKDLNRQSTQSVFDMTKRMNDQASQSNNTLQSTKDALINQVLSNRSEFAA
jgi:hypothetical protein